jgi:hypothetical protein
MENQMPRFFFHLRSPYKSLIDCEGMMLRDVEAARGEATKAVQNFFQPSTGGVQVEWEDWRIEVSDQRGRCVFAMAFADAAPPAPSQGDPLPERGAPVVVHLDIARAKRELSSLEKQMRTLIRRASALVGCTRSQSQNLVDLLKEAQGLRETSRALLDRSRQQSLLDTMSLAKERHGGDRARLSS